MTRDLGRPPGEGGGLGLQRPPEEGQAGQQGGGHRGGGGGGGGHEDGRGHRYEEGGNRDGGRSFPWLGSICFLGLFSSAAQEQDRRKKLPDSKEKGQKLAQVLVKMVKISLFQATLFGTLPRSQIVFV